LDAKCAPRRMPAATIVVWMRLTGPEGRLSGIERSCTRPGNRARALGVSRTGSALMGKVRALLLIAAGTLAGLVAGAGLGRYVLNVPTTPVGSSGPATQDNAANNVGCFDNAGHKVTFVAVEPEVQLEVLDWGGTGATLVLLAGLGDNAHVYDEF